METQTKMEQASDHFAEKIAENMHAFGVTTTIGRVLGTIYMNRKPMTLDELSEATGMSKTRMSQVVREMIDLGVAEKVFEKGIRKDLYQVEQDYYQTFISLTSSNWRKAVNKGKNFGHRWHQEITNILRDDAHNERDKEIAVELLDETKAWTEYYDWIDRLVDFFESGEVFKYVPKQKKKR